MIKEYRLLQNTERLALSTAASVNGSGLPVPETAIAGAARRKLALEGKIAWSPGLDVSTTAGGGGGITSAKSDSPTWWVMHCRAEAPALSSWAQVTHVPLLCFLPRQEWMAAANTS